MRDLVPAFMREFQTQDFALELLVREQIANQALAIDAVYRELWVRSEGKTAMVVVFRLQGVNGEARKAVFDRIADADELPPAERFAFTSVLAEGDGLLPFVDALRADLIGSLAEEHVDAAAPKPFAITSEINAARAEKREAATERARQARDAALAGAVIAHIDDLLSEIEDDITGWECCICTDGYGFERGKLLGVYRMVRPFGTATLTASDLIAIHPECHARATPPRRA
jgi:hypothetical protein